MVVVQKRAEARDYLDIDALLRHGVDLPTALAAGSVVYGRSFNPLITLKALSFFDDVPMLYGEVRERLSAAGNSGTAIGGSTCGVVQGAIGSSSRPGALFGACDDLWDG